MHTITIYGSSDDLIEVEGAIREEFNVHDAEDGHYLAFSDGTVVQILYSNQGVWRISPAHLGTGVLTIDQAPADDEDNYTDRASLVIEDPARPSVVFGSRFAKGA